MISLLLCAVMLITMLPAQTMAMENRRNGGFSGRNRIRTGRDGNCPGGNTEPTTEETVAITETVTEPTVAEEPAAAETTGPMVENVIVTEVAAESAMGSAEVMAAAALAQGNCGDNLTWGLDDAGTLTISGKGAMYDYTEDQTNPAPWNFVAADIFKLVLEEGVTEIGDFAFAACFVIEDASFPSTLTRVGECAFDRLTRPDGNQYHRPFRSEINQTVRQWSEIQIEAGNEGFPGGDLASFVHHEPIIASGKYGDKVFWDLNENGTMEFFGSGDMDEFGATGSWLYDLNAKTIVISEGVTNIGKNAFETYGEDPLCVSLETVRIAPTVERVEEMAFAGCGALNIIIFSGDAPFFGEDCFWDVTATVYYPADNETWTSDVMQDYCGSITWVPYGGTRIVVSGACGDGLTWILDDVGTLTISGKGEMDGFADSSSMPWYDHLSSITSVVLDDGVTGIGNYAFDGCTALSSVRYIAYRVFAGCTALKSVTMEEGLKSIGSAAFEECTALTSIRIPNSI